MVLHTGPRSLICERHNPHPSNDYSIRPRKQQRILRSSMPQNKDGRRKLFSQCSKQSSLRQFNCRSAFLYLVCLGSFICANCFRFVGPTKIALGRQQFRQNRGNCFSEQRNRVISLQSYPLDIGRETFVESYPSYLPINASKIQEVQPDQTVPGGRDNSSLFAVLDDSSDDHASTKINFSMFFDFLKQRSAKNKTNASPSSSALPEKTCHIVAGGDRKLPDRNSPSVPRFIRTSPLLDKLDALFHAIAHNESAHLRNYGRLQPGQSKNSRDQLEYNETDLVASLKSSLEDAGFMLLEERDWDLCEALNSGYLLRLSIQPDFAKLDPGLGALFYPERQVVMDQTDRAWGLNGTKPLLFDGRVLIFRRGYSAEVTEGLLFLPKLDYLQTSLVQRSASDAVAFVSNVEKSVMKFIAGAWLDVSGKMRSFMSRATKDTPLNDVVDATRQQLEELAFRKNYDNSTEKSKPQRNKNTGLSLSRYGGTKTTLVNTPDRNDALAPFLVLNGDEVKEAVSANKNQDFKVACEYDVSRGAESTASVSLLERVSISDLVDFFSKGGRRRLLKSFLSKSQLVEPTYEEVVVIWRPVTKRRTRQKLARTLYNVAEIFDVEDRLPPKTFEETEPRILPIDIRVFKGVQMSNLPAVFPQTKLIFRPADAFLFDFITVFTLLAVLASQRFDNPKFDLIALVSVSLWLARTFFRYSNKFARYDLLVKKFLTSKLALRGADALQYITTERGYHRAVRAGLCYYWMLSRIPTDENSISESDVLLHASEGINDMLVDSVKVDFDAIAALRDLEEIELVKKGPDRYFHIVRNNTAAISTLRERWKSLFE